MSKLLLPCLAVIITSILSLANPSVLTETIYWIAIINFFVIVIIDYKQKKSEEDLKTKEEEIS